MDTIIGFSELVLRPTLVLLAAGGVVLALRPLSAATRHLAWTVGLLAALLVPVAGTIGPDVPVRASERLTRLVEAGPFAAPTSPSAGDAETGRAATVSGNDTAREGGDAAGGDAAGTDLASLVSSVPWRAIWLAGFVGALGLLGLRLLGLRRVGTAARPATPALADRFDAARARLGVDRAVALLIGDEAAMPMTWGVVRPRVLLPAAAATWPPDQLEAVLLHELAHVRRHDVALQRVGELARAVFWFNPLAWLAARRMVVEREHACDDVVLGTGVRGSDYAHQLLAMANSLRSSRAAAGLPMARKSQMTGRLLAILDERRTRHQVGGAGPAVALGLGLAAALLVGAVRPVSAGDEPGTVEPAAVVESPETGPRCWHPPGDANSNTNHDPGLITAEVRTTRCFVFLRIAGYAILQPDSAGFSWLEPGGRISISETEGNRGRRLVLRGGPSGEVERTGTENGAALSPAAVDAWLAGNLRPLLRKTRVRLEVGPAP